MQKGCKVRLQKVAKVTKFATSKVVKPLVTKPAMWLQNCDRTMLLKIYLIINTLRFRSQRLHGCKNFLEKRNSTQSQRDSDNTGELLFYLFTLQNIFRTDIFDISNDIRIIFPTFVGVFKPKFPVTMSKFLFYLKVKPFIAQWLEYHYGSPVTFPNGSDENDCIHQFVSRCPKDLEPKDITRPVLSEDDGRKWTIVAFTVPDCRAKPAETYNYMGATARSALLEVIDWRFNHQLWKDLKDSYEKHYTILNAVRDWCEKNGISIDYDFTIKMRLQRKKKRHLKYGIDTRRQNRTDG